MGCPFLNELLLNHPSKMWILLCSIAILLFGGTSGQVLKATKLTTNLPQELQGLSAIYDGDDVIYLLGGQGEGFFESNVIYRFSIAAETIEEIAQMPNKGTRGSVQYSADQASIFYLGGYDDWTYNAVFRFEPDSLECTKVAVFNNSVKQGPSVSMGDYAIIFGALGNFDLLAFNMLTLGFEKVGSFPSTPARVAFEHTAVKVGDRLVYIFNDGSSVGDENVVVFNLSTFDASVVSTSLPKMKDEHPTSIYDGDKYVYLIGGHKSGSSGVDTDTIIMFDHETFGQAAIKVEEFPVGGNFYFSIAPAAVYVEKLDRIYLFGGLVREDGNFAYQKTLNDIYYLDLGEGDLPTAIPTVPSTVAPTTTPSTTTTNPATTAAPTTTTVATTTVPQTTTLPTTPVEQTTAPSSTTAEQISTPSTTPDVEITTQSSTTVEQTTSSPFLPTVEPITTPSSTITIEQTTNLSVSIPSHISWALIMITLLLQLR